MVDLGNSRTRMLDSPKENLKEHGMDEKVFGKRENRSSHIGSKQVIMI